MNAKSVCIFCDCKNRGGVLSYSLHLAKALGLKGYQVTFISYTPGNEAMDDILADIKENANGVYLIDREDSLDQKISKIKTHVNLIAPNFFIPNYRIDSYAACTGILNSNINIVGVCHSDNDSEYFTLSRYESVIDIFVCPAKKSFGALKNKLKHRSDSISHIPHCVDTVDKMASYDGGILKLVYHGRLTEVSKRVSLLLDVAEELKVNGTPFSLTLIGDGDTEKYIDMVEGRNLSDVITIKRAMSGVALFNELSNYHVELLVSEYEGFCLSLAESLSLGMPGVAFECGGVINEYLLDGVTGYLIKQGDIDSMVKKIETIQQSPTNWQSMSNQAQMIMKDNYSFECFSNRYDHVFSNDKRSEFRKKWPLCRPNYLNHSKYTVRDLVEYFGKYFGFWK